MLDLLCPDMYVERVTDIKLDILKQKGFFYILLDLDNTIVPWGESEFIEGFEEWFEKAVLSGFNICIISNSSPGRASNLSLKLKIPFICPALKPFKRAFLKALHILKGEPSQTIMIGDQIFTDILGGKRAGFYTILVKPVHNRELFTTRMVRTLEKLVINLLKNKKKFPP